MSKLPLVEGVSNYIKEKNIYFCMPGHKYGKGFLKTEEGKKLYENFIKGDITEVDGVDNFHHAEGIIKESQELLSKLYESKKSYFLVNGSTSGNLAMIFSCLNEGDKVIVERNCHRSIFNGIIMRKLKPIYIKNKVDNEYDAPLSIDEEHFYRTIDENKDAKAIIVTYPNYYGVCIDLKKIIDISKKYNMKVLVDSAHGAHFGISPMLPQSAVKLGADMVVMSAHKTLPSLTQTAYFHITREEDIEKADFYISSFLSTSPSYMLMQSMDYARFYLETYGYEQYNMLLNICNKYRKKINTLKGFHVLELEDINKTIMSEKWKSNIDKTRFVINVEKGYSGYKLSQYLRENRIQAEMSDNRNVILIFSPFNTKEEFEVLYKVLSKCNINKLKCNYTQIFDYSIPEAVLYPYEVMNKNKKKVNIESAKGHISASAIVSYPPGIPLVMPGEVINKETIQSIMYYKGNNIDVLGVKDEEVLVVE